MVVSNRQFYEGLPQGGGLEGIAQSILEKYLQQFPFVATDLGLHDWDGQLPPLSEDAFRRFRQELNHARSLLDEIDINSLDREARADHSILRHNVESLWLDFTRDHPEKRDPNLFNAMISESLLSLARGSFGTLEERARSAVSRLNQIPGFLNDALAQLEDPPVLFVDMAISQFMQTVPFFHRDLPSAFAKAPNGLSHEIYEAAQNAAHAYEKVVGMLQDNIKPRAAGDYRLGASRYQEKFYWLEGSRESLESLVTRGMNELGRLQEKMAALTKEYAPGRSVNEAIHRIRQNHASCDELLPQTQGLLAELRQFVENRGLVSLPLSPHPRVVETPAFMRMTTLASIVPPGPFEPDILQAYFQLTLPDSQWPEEARQSQLQTLNQAALRLIAIHEVYPGHFLQFLHIPTNKSTVRRVFGSAAFMEGWAHYAEEMMIEQGYGVNDPAVGMTQVLEALERVGRFIGGIQLHRGTWSLEETEKFFENACYMTPLGAKRESLRGTEDPFYLVYTWGKLQIMDLRRKAQTKWGPEFTLKRFHDAILSQGMPMIPVLSKLLFP